MGQIFGRGILRWKPVTANSISPADLALMRRIYKGQFSLEKLRIGDRSTPAIWNAVLAA